MTTMTAPNLTIPRRTMVTTLETVTNLAIGE